MRNIRFIILSFITLFLASFASEAKDARWMSAGKKLQIFVTSEIMPDKCRSVAWDGDQFEGLAHGAGTLTFFNRKGLEISSMKCTCRFGVPEDISWESPYYTEKAKKGFGIYDVGETVIIGTIGGRYSASEYDKESCSLVYKGEYRGTSREGVGQSYDSEGRVVYSGEWKKGVYWGEGDLFKNGDLLYRGGFKNGVQHGKGKLMKDGKVISGKWSEGYQKRTTNIVDAVNNQISAMKGNEIALKQDVSIDDSQTSLTAFIMDTLSSTFQNYVERTVEENVAARFGLKNMPRMLWQSIVTSDGKRIIKAEKALTKDLSQEDLEDIINERYRHFKDVKGITGNESRISLREPERGEIIDEQMLAVIKERERMEWSDIIAGILVDILIALVIGYIIGFILGLIFGAGAIPVANVIGIVLSIVGIIVGFFISIRFTGEASLLLENQISQMLTERIMQYFNSCNIFNQLL